MKGTPGVGIPTRGDVRAVSVSACRPDRPQHPFGAVTHVVREPAAVASAVFSSLTVLELPSYGAGLSGPVRETCDWPIRS